MDQITTCCAIYERDARKSLVNVRALTGPRVGCAVARRVDLSCELFRGGGVMQDRSRAGLSQRERLPVFFFGLGTGDPDVGKLLI